MKTSVLESLFNINAYLMACNFIKKTIFKKSSKKTFKVIFKNTNFCRTPLVAAPVASLNKCLEFHFISLSTFYKHFSDVRTVHWLFYLDIPYVCIIRFKLPESSISLKTVSTSESFKSLQSHYINSWLLYRTTVFNNSLFHWQFVAMP